MKSDLRGKDLKGQNLSKAGMSQVDLSGSNLFDAKLKDADLVGANLSGCDMTHCDLRGADLTKADLRGARLWGADMSGAVLSECDLSDADLWNAKLFNVKLWHANLTGARSLVRSSFSDGSKHFPRIHINESGPAAAEESYRDLKRLFLNNGLYNDAGWASFREKVMERLVMKKKGNINYFPSLLMSVLCGYGEKPYRIVLSAAFTILAFAFGYMLLDGAEYTMGANYAMNPVDYIYFSTITFTTVGFGDFLPRAYPLFRAIAATEAFLGVFLSGLFIFTLARKYSAR
jgi:uncharacterized protein YjbI with pentapeptide repeats